MENAVSSTFYNLNSFQSKVKQKKQSMWELRNNHVSVCFVNLSVSVTYGAIIRIWKVENQIQFLMWRSLHSAQCGMKMKRSKAVTESGWDESWMIRFSVRTRFDSSFCVLLQWEWVRKTTTRCSAFKHSLLSLGLLLVMGICTDIKREQRKSRWIPKCVSNGTSLVVMRQQRFYITVYGGGERERESTVDSLNFDFWRVNRFTG